MRLLVAMQYWDGDREAAMDQLRVLAGIQSVTHDPVDVAVFRAWEAEPMPRELFDELHESFDQVYSMRCMRRATGYPAGPNNMWHDLMCQSVMMYRSGDWGYSAILTIEADCCPVSAHYARELLSDWARGQQVVLGAWSPLTQPGLKEDIGHVNGNALFHPALTSMDSRLEGCPGYAAWDTWHAPTLKRLGWRDTRLIFNDYRAETMSEARAEELARGGVVLVHGVRDNSLREWARKKLCTTQGSQRKEDINSIDSR